MKHIYARDVIAVILLVGAFWLKYNGLNGGLDLIIAAIIGYYFSKRVYEEANGEFK